MLKGVDGRIVRVIEEVTPYWKDVAVELGFNHLSIEKTETDCPPGGMMKACQEMFMRWLDGGHDLAQPCTWDTLINCLRRAALISVANSLKEVLGLSSGTCSCTYHIARNIGGN